MKREVGGCRERQNPIILVYEYFLSTTWRCSLQSGEPDATSDMSQAEARSWGDQWRVLRDAGTARLQTQPLLEQKIYPPERKTEHPCFCPVHEHREACVGEGQKGKRASAWLQGCPGTLSEPRLAQFQFALAESQNHSLLTTQATC